MKLDLEFLINISKKTGLFDKAICTTTQIAKDFKISQQSASRKLKELEKKGYLKRVPAKEGFEIMLNDLARDKIIELKKSLDNACKARNILKGKLTKGLGEGKFYTQLKGYKFKDALGFNPYPGTLNLKISKTQANQFLFNKKKIRIDGFKTKDRTFGELITYPVNLYGRDAAIILPNRSSHPDNIIEVIAPFFIRGAFNLNDDDEVTIK
ncbi:MAG: DUF120 domain-containing protein [Nanobdellota archaeon]